MGRVFNNVTLEAVQETEIHRTLENDRTVTEVELPGVVNLYVVIDGGRLLLDRLNAGKVLEAIDLGQQQQQAQGQSAAQQQQAAGQTATQSTDVPPSQPPAQG